ncbi:MAG TPA: hypothetical protein EYO59_04730, partial [Chromatiaceae bacterium]|nr:hypothetical protein [Chromatiaceae bacterium]
DIITPSRSDLAAPRAEGRLEQNYRIDHPAVPKRALIKRLLRRPERYYHPSVGYYEHMPAWRVKTYIGDEIWGNYYKFSFERNPWDRQVSFYYYKTRNAKKRPSLETFLKKRRKSYVENYDLHTIDGENALDFVGRYETLEEDFGRVIEQLGLTDKVRLPRANVNSMGGIAPYRDMYTEKTRNQVAEWYAREIEAFGYEF